MTENIGLKYVYLVGNPVEHSVSPQMHNAAYKALGLDFEYKSMKVEDSGLETAVNQLRKEDVAGFNVTIPHK